MAVSFQEFLAFVKVQMSGVTNMYDMKRVCSLAHISEQTYRIILRDYDYLSDIYPEAFV